MMGDYEEQVLVTGVKSGKHCPICKVPPSKRQNLTHRWPQRTHHDTQQQIQFQRRVQRSGEAAITDQSMWVHDFDNFAWRHHLVNIHEIMMMDLLHQLLKGTLQYLIQWISQRLEDIRPLRRRPGERSRLEDAGGRARLDQRFRHVPPYPSLKLFGNFSDIIQWTGDGYLDVARQLMPVITPLLLKDEPAALLYARAVLDFMMLARFRSHNTATLEYMEHALFRMDKLKWVFSKYRPDAQFNFPKFHVVTHYMDYIRRFGTLDGVDTAHGESAHPIIVKEPYKRTNKRKDFEDQIIRHDARRLAMSSIENTYLVQNTSGQHALEADERLCAKVTTPSRALDLVQLGWKEEDSIPKTKATVSQISPFLHALREDFRRALVMFIRQERQRRDQQTLCDPAQLRDYSWVDGFKLQVHGSITTWKPDGKQPRDPDHLVSELMRCSPCWQGKQRDWRRDFVWCEDSKQVYRRTGQSALGARSVCQLLLIFTVEDPMVQRAMEPIEGREQGPTASFRPFEYCGAFVEVLQPRRNGQPHPYHGMLEMEVQSTPSPRTRQIIAIDNILRGAHIVPAQEAGGGVGQPEIFFVNNYIDWDQFNTLYDPDFLAAGKQLAIKFEKKLHSRREKD